mgnify:CR=1 FL=1
MNNAATVRNIAAALAQAGISDVSLAYDRSARHWYFTGAGTDDWSETIPCGAHRLNAIDVETYVAEAVRMNNEA